MVVCLMPSEKVPESPELKQRCTQARCIAGAVKVSSPKCSQPPLLSSELLRLENGWSTSSWVSLEPKGEWRPLRAAVIR